MSDYEEVLFENVELKKAIDVLTKVFNEKKQELHTFYKKEIEKLKNENKNLKKGNSKLTSNIDDSSLKKDEEKRYFRGKTKDERTADECEKMLITLKREMSKTKDSYKKFNELQYFYHNFYHK